jgi:hypothetical protein
MTQEYPITPPPELLQRLYGLPQMRAIEAAFQAGADQELEACSALLELSDDNAREYLQSTRRPEPPSLKEQALEELEKVDMLWDTTEFSQETLNSLNTIRRALEALDA